MLRCLKVLPLMLALACLTTFSTSCGSSKAKIRFVQAIPDVNGGQPVDIYLDGAKSQSAIAFPSPAPSSGYLSTSGGSRHLQVFLAGQTTGALFDGSISLSSGSEYTVVLTGSVTSNTVAAALLTDNNTAPTSGNVFVRVIHASPSWNAFFQNGTMDVFVVAPATNIVGVTPTISALGYTKASGYVSAPAGTYEVIATPANLPAEIIVGGPFTFNSGDIRTVVFIDAPGGGLGGAPVVLNDLGN
jgi:uncharacterized protein DUF4397